jgi:hypothetical protein
LGDGFIRVNGPVTRITTKPTETPDYLARCGLGCGDTISFELGPIE